MWSLGQERWNGHADLFEPLYLRLRRASAVTIRSARALARMPTLWWLGPCELLAVQGFTSITGVFRSATCPAIVCNAESGSALAIIGRLRPAPL